LEQDPYLRVKAELEKYLMREEEIERIFAQTIRQEISNYFEQNATSSPEGDYHLVKVSKAKFFPKKE
jgi:hypothetical protein